MHCGSNVTMDVATYCQVYNLCYLPEHQDQPIPSRFVPDMGNDVHIEYHSVLVCLMYGHLQRKSSSVAATFTQIRTLVGCGVVIIHTEVCRHVSVLLHLSVI